MPDKPAPPTPSEQPPTVASEAREEGAEPGERYGMLALHRHLKDDGRAVILFERIEHGPT